MVDVLAGKPGWPLVIPDTSSVQPMSKFQETGDSLHVIELISPLLCDTDGQMGCMLVKVIWRAGNTVLFRANASINLHMMCRKSWVSPIL